MFIPRENNKEVDDWQKSNLNKKGIIREGEATGHHHRLEDPTMATVYRPDWGMPIVVTGDKPVTVVHPEHGPVVLEPKTTYDVNVAREFDITGEVRYVAD